MIVRCTDRDLSIPEGWLESVSEAATFSMSLDLALNLHLALPPFQRGHHQQRLQRLLLNVIMTNLEQYILFLSQIIREEKFC